MLEIILNSALIGMRKIISYIGAYLLRKILSLRYDIRPKNLHLLYEKGYHEKGGILFLPNHSAEIDPIILQGLLETKFHPRPLVIENFFYLKGARFFMNFIRALPVPNFLSTANKWKLRQVEKCLKSVEEGVRGGDNFLIYPSGHLKSEGYEIIGGSSFVYRILEVCPDVRIVLVRTTGLWGSLFSRAITGKSPDFWSILLRGALIVLKNGIFFLPKRRVDVEFALPPEDFPYKGTRLELNRYLENWYNRYQDREGNIVFSEPVQLISFSRWSEKLPMISERGKIRRPKEELEVPQHIRSSVYRELSKLSGFGVSEIRDDMDLSRDLGLDSLDLAGVHAFLEERYEIETGLTENIYLVQDLFELIIEGRIARPREEPLGRKGAVWPKEEGRSPPLFPEGETLQEAFLSVCDRMKSQIACGDESLRLLTYQKFKTRVMILARKFETFPEKHIGVLLPSSVIVYIIVFALLLARKIPVLLNWTTGARSLNFAHDLLNLSTVITSRKFLEKAPLLDLGILENKLLLLEEFRYKISSFDKFAGFLLAKKGSAILAKRFQLSTIHRDDPAIILFTSGTETYPKAVPLSHHNLLSNQKAALESIHLREKDILYGALPPFHSFGFSVTGILPFLIGLRVFYGPDPTDSYRIARDCLSYSITLLCLSPSFYKNLFRVATPGQLRSVRLFISGAEKTPPELFAYVDKLGGGREMIEGYGITECSPVVTLCQEGEPPKGVGKPIPGFELCIIDQETGEKREQGEQGEICIKGPSVFQGYLGKEVTDPFVEIEGKRWYRSGDLGRIDEEGNLILEGRMKRFVKIGGEMVSLVALEEELTTFAEQNGWIAKEEERPQLTIGVREKEGERPQLILFTTFPISKEEINNTLRRAGFGSIIKIAEVRQVAEIPLTGLGKVQYRKVKEWVGVK